MSTFVYYFIPEDNELETSMNVFMIYKNYKDVKLSDIKENFPVPGEYYFRFKFEFNGKKVWIDFNNPNGALPQFDGKVIMKVTRLNFNEQKQPQQNNNIFPEI